MIRVSHDNEMIEEAIELKVQRGSLITVKSSSNPSLQRAIVMSNNFQNEMSDFIVVVPLERRVSRLHAPFAVDLGRSEGLRELHTARCDWVTTIEQHEINSIERARFSDGVLSQLEHALRSALGFRDAM